MLRPPRRADHVDPREAARRNPDGGYTRDVIDLLRGVLPAAVRKGVKVISNAGGANPRAAAERVLELAKELGLSGVRVAVVTGDDIEADIDRLMDDGVSFANLDTGAELVTVRERLTHAAVYTGCEGIVEALRLGADIVICGRVTDIALYLGPLIHEFGWATDDWQRLGMATVVAHAIECGGQATGGLYAGGLAGRRGARGRSVTRSPRCATTAPPSSPRPRAPAAEVDIGTVSEQLVYEILDPAQLPHRRRHRRLHPGDARGGRPGPGADHRRHRPARVRRRSRSTWATAPGSSARRSSPTPGRTPTPRPSAALAFLRNAAGARRLRVQRGPRRVPRSHLDVGQSRVPAPTTRSRLEIVVRYAARCPDAEQARKVFTESVPLYNNGPAGVAGVGTRPPLKELYAIWPCLIPREHVVQRVELTGGGWPCAWPTSPTAGPATRATSATSGSSPGTTPATRCCERSSPRSGSPSTTATWSRARSRATSCPGIRALNFVLTGALDGGGTMSLRSDHLGKVMYAWLLRMELAVERPGWWSSPARPHGRRHPEPARVAQPARPGLSRRCSRRSATRWPTTRCGRWRSPPRALRSAPAATCGR